MSSTFQGRHRTKNSVPTVKCKKWSWTCRVRIIFFSEWNSRHIVRSGGHTIGPLLYTRGGRLMRIDLMIIIRRGCGHCLTREPERYPWEKRPYQTGLEPVTEAGRDNGTAETAIVSQEWPAFTYHHHIGPSALQTTPAQCEIVKMEMWSMKRARRSTVMQWSDGQNDSAEIRGGASDEGRHRHTDGCDDDDGHESCWHEQWPPDNIWMVKYTLRHTLDTTQGQIGSTRSNTFSKEARHFVTPREFTEAYKNYEFGTTPVGFWLKKKYPEKILEMKSIKMLRHGRGLWPIIMILRCWSVAKRKRQ